MKILNYTIKLNSTIVIYHCKKNKIINEQMNTASAVLPSETHSTNICLNKSQPLHFGFI